MSESLGVRLRHQLGRARGAFSLDVEFTAAPGFTILFGASGAGKTTILDCVAGLLSPVRGRISIGDRLLLDTSSKVNLPAAKRHLGYVFQDLALFPHLTVRQNIEYGLGHMPRNQRRVRSTEILEAFRIEGLAQRRLGDVSGGEGQRVALARTLVTDPGVLLLDEPLTALDSSTKARIVADLRSWNRAHGIPILYVTHSRDEVFALGERVVALDAGRVLAQGTPHEVLEAPYQETIAQLAGFENVFDARVESMNAERGTMTCGLAGDQSYSVLLETPLIRASVGETLRIGIRAGDVLLATQLPQGLSARNVLAGRLVSLEVRDVIVSAHVNCGVDVEVHLTLAARDALELSPGKNVWLVVKTHSCHLMRNPM